MITFVHGNTNIVITRPKCCIHYPENPLPYQQFRSQIVKNGISELTRTHLEFGNPHISATRLHASGFRFPGMRKERRDCRQHIKKLNPRCPHNAKFPLVEIDTPVNQI
jgi:hypothetical protein